MIVLALTALILASIPALVFLVNLLLYRSPRPATGPLPPVSVLIPARNEAAGIAPAIESALASDGIELEVVVLDDHSEDDTAAVVSEIAARDHRVRLEQAPPLPPGWCGKQHACQVLAQRARFDILVFMDADVRLHPDGLRRMIGFLEQSGASLVSGVPRQVTGTWMERLVLPLIHFILLGFLPIRRMRRSLRPEYGAGCGQLFVARRGDYQKAGGHAAIRTSLHDGLTLPRAFRRAGLRTDLCDATEVATCRMYRGAGEVWRGLAKNATEGLAVPGMIVPATLLLFLGQVLPLFLLAAALWSGTPTLLAVSAGATALAYLPRVVGVIRFRQSILGAALHPLGVLLLLAIQWYALGCKLFGRPAGWKGRNYSVAPA